MQQQQGSASPASQLAVLLWTAGELRNSQSRNLFGTTSSPVLLCLPRSFVSRSSANQTLLFSIPNWSHNNVETTHTPISPDDFSQSPPLTSL